MPGPYTVATNKVGQHDFVLTANTVEQVTFVDNIVRAQINWDGTAKGYFTVDNSTPTVGGSNCYPLPNIAGVYRVEMPGSYDTIKIISAGTPTLTISRIP